MTKITVETTEEDYFLFLKFKESKDASFACFETTEQYQRGYNNFCIKKTFHILSKSAFSESVNKKMVVFETQIYQLEIENNSLKKKIKQLEMENEKMKGKKKFFSFTID